MVRCCGVDICVVYLCMRKNPPYLPVSPHHVHYQHTKGWKIILKTGYLPAFLPLFYSHLLLSGKTDSVVKDGLRSALPLARARSAPTILLVLILLCWCSFCFVGAHFALLVHLRQVHPLKDTNFHEFC